MWACIVSYQVYIYIYMCIYIYTYVCTNILFHYFQVSNLSSLSFFSGGGVQVQIQLDVNLFTPGQLA